MSARVVRWVALGALVVASFTAAAPVQAASKSVTVQVSCSIPERIEMSAARAAIPSPSSASAPVTRSFSRESMELARSGGLMTVRSTLMGRYDISERMLMSAAGAMKLFTVTAV